MPVSVAQAACCLPAALVIIIPLIVLLATLLVVSRVRFEFLAATSRALGRVLERQSLTHHPIVL